MRDNFFDRPLEERRAEFENKLAQLLGRPEGEGAIASMVDSRSSRWTPQDDDILRKMAGAKARPEIIAGKLNRTVHAVKARAYAIGLPLKWFKLKGKAKP